MSGIYRFKHCKGRKISRKGAKSLDKTGKFNYYCKALIISRVGAVVARRAHNPKVVGSNPSPATIILPV